MSDADLEEVNKAPLPLESSLTVVQIRRARLQQLQQQSGGGGGGGPAGEEQEDQQK